MPGNAEDAIGRGDEIVLAEQPTETRPRAGGVSHRHPVMLGEMHETSCELTAADAGAARRSARTMDADVEVLEQPGPRRQRDLLSDGRARPAEEAARGHHRQEVAHQCEVRLAPILPLVGDAIPPRLVGKRQASRTSEPRRQVIAAEPPLGHPEPPCLGDGEGDTESSGKRRDRARHLHTLPHASSWPPGFSTARVYVALTCAVSPESAG